MCEKNRGRKGIIKEKEEGREGENCDSGGEKSDTELKKSSGLEFKSKERK